MAQTLAWDPSPDATVTGYRVRYGPDPASLYSIVDVAKSFTYPLSTWSRDRAWYFCVEAYTAQQLTSLCSDVVVLPQAPSETYAQWSARLGAGVATADPDADGVLNATEFTNKTDPFVPNRWLFAEGATGAFREEIALANPGADAARVRLRVFPDGQPSIDTLTSVPAASRATVTVNDLPGLGVTAARVEVTAETGGVVAERTMTWTSPEGTRPAHTAKGIPAPAQQWFFAEGEARLTDTFFLVANPDATKTDVLFVFVTDGGQIVTRYYPLAANARLSVWANQIQELQGKSFMTTVHGMRPIVAERAMYFWSGKKGWRGGHLSAGASALAQRWFVAEGRTGPFFDTYLLLGNPNYFATTVTLRYLTPAGLARTEVRTMAGRSRLTVAVDGLQGLADTDVSVAVDSVHPIVVERSMYWPGDATTWRDGHNSLAIATLGTRWVFAEGRWNDEEFSESYVLLANPNAVKANVTLRVLREPGRPPITLTRVIAANSRQTLRIDNTVGLVVGEHFSVEVVADQPIAVERSIYTSVGGTWTSGTNETGTRLR